MADFWLIGGDARQRYLALALREAGHRAQTFGVALEPQELLRQAEVVCLPVPSLKGEKIPGEFSTFLPLEEALPRIAGRILVCYASAAQEALLRERAKPSFLLNLAEDETFLTENAILTAEGAIRAASGHRDTSLWGSRCLVLGYGRIGKALTCRLLALGASVTVVARSETARAAAAEVGARTADFAVAPRGADFVFNTVPARTLEEADFAALVGGALYVELASAPYAIDPERAQALGLDTLLLPGIPGKSYPRRAARAILDAIRRGLPREGLCLGPDL